MDAEIESRIDALCLALDEALGVRPSPVNELILSLLTVRDYSTEGLLHASGLFRKHARRERAEGVLSEALGALYGEGMIKPYMSGGERFWRAVAKRRAA